MVADAILKVAARGFRIFPVKLKGNNKQPAITGWQEKATTETEQLELWSREFLQLPRHGWGVKTGHDSKIFVVDVDVPCSHHQHDGREWYGRMVAEHGDEWSNTLRQRTPSGGTQLFFQMPPAAVVTGPDGQVVSTTEIRSSENELAPGVDIRGEGGLAIIAPTDFGEGPYEWQVDPDHPIRPAPPWLVEAGLKTRDTKRKSEATETRFCGEGQRTPMLASLCGKLLDASCTAEEVTSVLVLRNQQCCVPPKPEDAVRKLAQDMAARYSSTPLPYFSGAAPILAAKNTLQWTAATRSFEEIAPVPTEYLWEPYLPLGALSLLTGPPDVGKTWIAQERAAWLSLQGIATIFLTQENDPARVLRPRFDALGGDCRHLHLLQGKISPQQPTPQGITLIDVPILYDAIRKHTAKLLIIDPIQSYFPAGLDAYKAHEIRPLLDGLTRMAEELQVVVWMQRHITKAAAQRAIFAGQGSADITAAVRSEMLAGKVRGRWAMTHIKHNLSAQGPTLEYEILGSEGTTIFPVGLFRWKAGISDLTSADLLAPEEKAGRGRTTEATSFLREFLGNGARLADEIEGEARRAGISPRTLRRARKQLGVESQKQPGKDGPWEVSLPLSTFPPSGIPGSPTRVVRVTTGEKL